MEGLFRDRLLMAPDARTLQKTVENQISISEIEILLPDGSTVSAFYVRPKADGKYPGLLYCHWLERSPDDNKTQFLEEARLLAARGHVCLLVDTVFADWPESRLTWTGVDSAFDRGIILRQIRELRYCLELLRSRPEVDRERLALVGHDFGAMFNSVLAGIEDDIRACVIMAAVPDFSDWFTLNNKISGPERQAYYEAMADLAPAGYLAAAGNTSFLFQFGEDDLFFVPKQKAELLVDKTGGPKAVKWYESDHAIHRHPGATDDRVNWLRGQLNPNGR